MPIYFFWGDDDFLINEEFKSIKKDFLDLNWLEFNYHKFNGEKEDFIRDGLMEAMTPPFGSGDRLIVITDVTFCQQCSEDLLKELNKVLPQIPPTTHLLFTSKKKPNNKLKSSQLINQYAQVKEFSLIPPWQTETLIKKVAEVAEKEGVKITNEGQEILANCVGNDSLLLWQEMKKLAIYQGNNSQPLDGEIIKSLVNVSNQNSLHLAEAILENNLNYALQLVQDLINLNEPALRIVATLTGQFRTWTIVKTAMESGINDEKKIAEIAEIHNPKRIFFIKKQIRLKTAKQLQSSLPILLELEANLKMGAEALSTLETKIIELCCL